MVLEPLFQSFMTSTVPQFMTIPLTLWAGGWIAAACCCT